MGMTKLQISSTDDLTFADSAEGAQIFQNEDLLAIVSWQSAGNLSSNLSQVFTVPG
jgi:serralysin